LPKNDPTHGWRKTANFNWSEEIILFFADCVISDILIEMTQFFTNNGLRTGVFLIDCIQTLIWLSILHIW